MPSRIQTGINKLKELKARLKNEPRLKRIEIIEDLGEIIEFMERPSSPNWGTEEEPDRDE